MQFPSSNFPFLTFHGEINSKHMSSISGCLSFPFVQFNANIKKNQPKTNKTQNFPQKVQRHSDNAYNGHRQWRLLS